MELLKFLSRLHGDERCSEDNNLEDDLTNVMNFSITSTYSILVSAQSLESKGSENFTFGFCV
jgi:hypothetical protein